MRQLILLRHAKTETIRPGLDDHDRALTLAGWDDAPRVMRMVMSGGLRPDLVLCSTARRCRQTLEAMEDLLSDAAKELREELYLAEDDAVLDIATRAAAEHDAKSVLVIGHNPGLRSLAGRLSPMNAPRAGELRSSFPTSSIAVLERAEDGDADWRLLAFIRPSDLTD